MYRCIDINCTTTMKNILILVAAVICLGTVSGAEEFSNIDFLEPSDADDNSYNRVRRAGFNMLRLGRGLQMLRLGKRGLPMLRLGRSNGDTLSDEDLEYLLSLVRNVRRVPLPRNGQDLAFDNMLLSALQNAEFESEEPNLGLRYDIDLASERQIRPAPRPGRYRRAADTHQDNSEKDTDEHKQKHENDNEAWNKYESERVAPLMRYGKDENDDEKDKRAMKMLRMGRGMRMLRLGKRPDDGDMSEAEKRALHVLRLGKRAFNMLRLGRGDNKEEKQTLNLLRLGKKVRIGRAVI